MDPTETSAPVCYRHPDRITGLSCSRCGKNICVECSNDAAVGQLCPECAASTDRHQVVRAGNLSGRASFSTAPVSFSILAVTVAIWVIGVVSPVADRWLFQNLAQANFLVSVGEWWRIFTAALLHAPLRSSFGIFHIGFNMYLLYLLGPRMEQQVGSPAFGALYVAAAGTGGFVAYQFGDPFQISIGASGAIFGLVGAWLVASWKTRHTPGGRAMFNQLMFFVLLNAVLGFAISNISWRAHLGGLLAGMGIAYLWSIFAVGKPNAVGIRTAVATAVIALDLAAVLLL
ncbi:MAG: rhomboid family intramembrane serine protease [Acidimicrobiia bacterium]|nr:MAG: rhomboid family intramembrane serine protease [Acidimicrobiia bacterium]